MSVQLVVAPQRVIKTPKRVRPVRYEVVHPRQLSLIAQVRGSYEKTDPDLLADNIAALGMQQAVGVAELDRAHCIKYLIHFSEVFGVQVSISELPQNVNGFYYIVIWGHRRTQASWLLWQNGCSDCRSQGGSSIAARCLRRHRNIDPTGIDAKVYRNISPEEAMMRQIAENTYLAPDRDREAEAIRNAWLVRKHSQTKLSMKQFAQETGRSAEFVADSLRFCLLPVPVRAMVVEGLLKFSGAVQLTRLQAAGLSDEAVVRTAEHAVVKKMTVPRIQALVKNTLLAQIPAEALFLVDEVDMHRKLVASVLDNQALRAFACETAVLTQASNAQRNGLLPATDPTRNGQVRRALATSDSLRLSLFGGK